MQFLEVTVQTLEFFSSLSVEQTQLLFCQEFKFFADLHLILAFSLGLLNYLLDFKCCKLSCCLEIMFRMFDYAFRTEPFHAGGIPAEVLDGFFRMKFAVLRKRPYSLINESFLRLICLACVHIRYRVVL